VRIYFHIRKDEDRGAAAMLERELETSAAPDSTPIVVPGIEHVAGAQSKSILKCFKKAECEALGPFLVKLIQDAGTVIELSDQSATYEKSTAMRPRHFEAWFAAGFGSASTAGAGAK
jgi:hypothetical protein